MLPSLDSARHVRRISATHIPSLSNLMLLLLLRAERLALKFVIALDKSRPNARDEHPAYRMTWRNPVAPSFGPSAGRMR